MLNMRLINCVVLASLLCASAGVTRAQEQQPSIPERVAALKAALATSQATLKHYEWIETTVVSLKGDEKSNKQQRCYYGADGGLQKVEVSASPEPDKKRGVRGRIVANRTEELTDYMKSAVDLVKTYIPPDPAKIQAAKDAGKVTRDLLEPGKRARLNFPDYQKPGDNLGVEIDLEKNVPLGMIVSTYLDDDKDAVKMDAHMGQLNDGTVYTSDITLNAVAKSITVTVKNSGYRKMN
jgi:hypothetical protein